MRRVESEKILGDVMIARVPLRYAWTLLLTGSLAAFTGTVNAAGGKAPAGDKAADEKKPSDDLASLKDGYISEWLVLVGLPFNLNPGAVRKRNFIPNEAKLRPREGYVFKHDKMLSTKPVSWKKFKATKGTLSFKGAGGKRGSMHYAVAYLVAPRAVKAAYMELKAPKDSWFLVNGRSYRSGTNVPLKEGYNCLLVRCPDLNGSASFGLRILDKDKKVDPTLKTALMPEAEEDEERNRSLLEPDNAFILLPKESERVSFANQMSPEAKAILKKAMHFVAESQRANGAWSDTNYPDSVGVSALCCLALLAEGNLPRLGRRGKALDKGIEFLLSSFRKEGICASPKVEGYGVIYGHVLSLLALLEVSGNVPWRHDIEDKISKGLQVVLDCQRVDGGWRYQPTTTGNSDISVTTTVLWMLGQARRNGYSVRKTHIDRAIQFLEKCGEADGSFRYRLMGKGKVQPHSGIGVAALYGAGRINHPLLPAARDRIIYEFKRYDEDDLKKRKHLLFGSFFASLAIYSTGSETWDNWYAKMVKVMAKLQQKTGEMYDKEGNKIYTTALAAVILQAPYGYLSIYVR